MQNKTHNMPLHAHRARSTLSPTKKHRVAVAVANSNRNREIPKPTLTMSPWEFEQYELFFSQKIKRGTIMNTESQNYQILNHLKKTSITAIEALNCYQCFRLAARIKDLRDMGHLILTEMMVTKNGKRIADYTLINEATKSFGEK